MPHGCHDALGSLGGAGPLFVANIRTDHLPAIMPVSVSLMVTVTVTVTVMATLLPKPAYDYVYAYAYA